MPSVISRLPSARFGETLKAMRQLSLEEKAPQRMSALSGIKTYKVEPTGTWSLSGTMTGSTSIGAAFRFNATLTGDGSQKWPNASPTIDMFINGTSEANRVPKDVLAGQRPWSIDANTALSFDSFGLVDPTYLDTEKGLRWIVAGWINGTVDFYIRARAQSSTPGSISVVKV